MLDDYDTDLRQFVTYVVAAVRNLFPEVCRTVQSMLKATDLPPVLARHVINDLAPIELPYFLALDDYHHVQDTAIRDLLDELMRHPPQSLHLVLITRRDPS